MGFTAGVTGGVTLTLTLAYLFTNSHHANRAAQSNILRSATYALDVASTPAGLAPPPPPLPPSQSLPATAGTRRRFLQQQQQQQQLRIEGSDAQSRLLLSSPHQHPFEARLPAHQTMHYYRAQPPFTERLKAWWNDEVQAVARVLQRTDWAAVGQQAEHRVEQLVRGTSHPYDRHVDSRTAAAAAAASRHARELAGGAAEVAGDMAHGAAAVVSDVAKGVADAAAAVRADAQAAAESAARHAAVEAENDRMRRLKAAVERPGEAGDRLDQYQSEGWLRGTWNRLTGSIDRGARAVEEKIERVVEKNIMGMSDVDRALAQRFDDRRIEREFSKSVDDILEERLQGKDRTVLRGI